MRRRFNQDILPQTPPPKGLQYSTREQETKFQIWFVSKLEEHGLSLREFCNLGNIKANTAQCWRYRSEPTMMYRLEIARVFARLENRLTAECLIELCNQCKTKKLKHAYYIAKHIK